MFVWLNKFMLMKWGQGHLATRSSLSHLVIKSSNTMGMYAYSKIWIKENETLPWICNHSVCTVWMDAAEKIILIKLKIIVTNDIQLFYILKMPLNSMHFTLSLSRSEDPPHMGLVGCTLEVDSLRYQVSLPSTFQAGLTQGAHQSHWKSVTDILSPCNI